MKKADITIDAKGKKIGRLASEAAYALRGKTKADFMPNSSSLPKVIIKNVDEIAFSEKKLKTKFFAKYSGYPSGRHLTSAFEVSEKDKREVLRHAISGMIHKNRLKKDILKNLVMYHGDNK